jgi:hypothetical protein
MFKGEDNPGISHWWLNFDEKVVIATPRAFGTPNVQTRGMEKIRLLYSLYLFRSSNQK